MQGHIHDDVRLLAGLSLADVRAVMASERVDHVIMGAGLELPTRLDVVREVFDASAVTTVHMKDTATGRDGFLPFVSGVLQGLRGFPQPTAPAPARRSTPLDRA